ncbi:hypothetical protein E4188_22695 (plasmid) [Aeromonas media]|uniref:Uncharacterized protein n=1 Tax=Aeromonas media TaxID=651 RepID=A0ABX6NY49_AERME|nr:hypothetical protein [Aeromonas media]QJT37090.1 hypothetical protein E4187_22630 [Aeromonas media]QJT41308.1 hypothetical protein E4188_22695 [Aeromonas media]
MKIHSDMDLTQLAERMGTEATPEDAAAMCDLLVEKFDGQDTSEIPEGEWLALLEEAAAA